MPETERQLGEAITAFGVAMRTAVEALLNRVTSIVTREQVERLKLLERVEALEVLAAALLKASEERERGT